ncbi:hypothetical protein ACQ4PT_004274 [Festuca glaucescens]
MAASMGDCEELKSLLNWGDAPVWPKPVAPQVIVEVPVDGDTLDHGITNGSLDVQQQASAGVVEEGAGDEPAAPSAESFLEGVTPFGDTALHVLAKSGMSPLYLAVVLGDYLMATILHEKDNQLSYSGQDGQNVLHVSVLKDIEMTETLLGWNKELAKKQCDNGSTPLHLHLCRTDVLVPILLEANLSAAYQPNSSGSFPIHIAASSDRLKAVMCFLLRCPECVNLCDTMGRTFLHVAVENRSWKIVSYACRTPSLASILNTQDSDGNTALHLAVQVGDLRIVCSLLREQQVDLEIPNNSGRTPRHLAWHRIPRGIFFHWNPQVTIFQSLCYAGARHGCYGASLLDERTESKLDSDRECQMIKDSTQTLGIGSVLIATVAFGANFALPGGYRADDHPNGGTPTLGWNVCL